MRQIVCVYAFKISRGLFILSVLCSADLLPIWYSVGILMESVEPVRFSKINPCCLMNN